jgi:hypothetical protein
VTISFNPRRPSTVRARRAMQAAMDGLNTVHVGRASGDSSAPKADALPAATIGFLQHRNLSAGKIIKFAALVEAIGRDIKSHEAD